VNDYLDGWLMKICGRMIVAMIRSATSAAGKTFVCKMLRRILVGKGKIGFTMKKIVAASFSLHR
jgi:hypothetical protein